MECICDEPLGTVCALHWELANRIRWGGMDRERTQMASLLREYRKLMVNRNGTWLTNASPEDLAGIALNIFLERTES